LASFIRSVNSSPGVGAPGGGLRCGGEQVPFPARSGGRAHLRVSDVQGDVELPLLSPVVRPDLAGDEILRSRMRQRQDRHVPDRPVLRAAGSAADSDLVEVPQDRHRVIEVIEVEAGAHAGPVVVIHDGLDPAQVAAQVHGRYGACSQRAGQVPAGVCHDRGGEDDPPRVQRLAQALREIAGTVRVEQPVGGGQRRDDPAHHVTGSLAVTGHPAIAKVGVHVRAGGEL
jgi:hypothetical protein